MSDKITELKRQVLKAAKGRRIPEPQPLVFLSAEFAWTLFPRSSEDEKSRLAERLRAVADYYYLVSEKIEASPARGPGRRQNKSDIVFVYAMADALNPMMEVRFRKSERTKVAAASSQREAQTSFQRICNVWMKCVDPDRSKPLQAAAFKEAGARWRTNRKKPYKRSK